VGRFYPKHETTDLLVSKALHLCSRNLKRTIYKRHRWHRLGRFFRWLVYQNQAFGSLRQQLRGVAAPNHKDR
jgi:hypothetical protein